MTHWYSPSWDQKVPGFQAEWCASEIPAGPLPLGLTWGRPLQLVSWVCCCVPKKRKKKTKKLLNVQETSKNGNE